MTELFQPSDVLYSVRRHTSRTGKTHTYDFFVLRNGIRSSRSETVGRLLGLDCNFAGSVKSTATAAELAQAVRVKLAWKGMKHEEI